MWTAVIVILGIIYGAGAALLTFNLVMEDAFGRATGWGGIGRLEMILVPLLWPIAVPLGLLCALIEEGWEAIQEARDKKKEGH